MNAHVQLLRQPEVRYARLDRWQVDVAANRLHRDGTEQRLTPKSMAVLRELMLRPRHVVKRDDLLGTVWRDGFPTDDVLTHAITELRRALDDDPRAPRLIETIPRVGYRLCADVEVLDTLPRPAATPPPTAPEPLQPPPPRQPWALAGGLLLLLALVAPALWRASASRDEATAVEAPPASSSNEVATTSSRPLSGRAFAVTAEPAREQFPSLSPDGSSVVYVAAASSGASSRIVLRSLDAAAAPRALTEPEVGMRDDFPVWSPDGTQIAFLRFDDQACSIRVMPALGGPSRRVGACRNRVLEYLEWTPDGQGLLLSRWRERPDGSMTNSYMHRLDLASGALEPLNYEPGVSDADIQPRVSPDGKMLAFRRGGAPYSDIYLVPLGGGEVQRITRLQSRMRGFAWYPDGRHILFSSDHEGPQTLHRLDTVTGSVVNLGIENAQFPDIARRAPVAVYQQESRLTQLAELELGEEGVRSSRLLAPATRSDEFPSYSPDGSHLAFVSARGGDTQLWLYDFETDSAFPLTRYRDVQILVPQWSPDGRSVLHIVRARGRSALQRVDVESGRIETLSRIEENVRFASWSMDGQWILFATDRGGSWQGWRMRPNGDNAEQLTRNGAIDLRDPLGDGSVYYTRETDRGLFRLDLATHEEVIVSYRIGYWNQHTWTLRPEGLRFLDSSEARIGANYYRAPIHPLRQRSDEAKVMPNLVQAIELPLTNLEATLAPDGQHLVVVTTTRDDTDLMALELVP